MPYVSKAQERWAHTSAGRKALGSKLGEFDAASRGLKLPERAKPKAGSRHGKLRAHIARLG